MAWLPAVLFEHIGEDVSAYSLNQAERPWDKGVGEGESGVTD
jgi:hypothetical protein